VAKHVFFPKQQNQGLNLISRISVNENGHGKKTMSKDKLSCVCDAIQIDESLCILNEGIRNAVLHIMALKKSTNNCLDRAKSVQRRDGISVFFPSTK